MFWGWGFFVDLFLVFGGVVLFVSVGFVFVIFVLVCFVCFFVVVFGGLWFIGG